MCAWVAALGAKEEVEMTRMKGVATLGAMMGAIALGCNGSKPVEPKPSTLRLIASHPLSFPEPSDLTINESGTVLWTVTNHPEKVRQLDLDGTLVRTLPYDGNDLEGVVYDPSDSTLWVAEENRREVVHLDLNGNVLSRTALGLTGERNSGLEGICLDDAGRMFLLNEKHPGLFLETNPDLSIASQLTLTFADDYSGMSYDRQKSCYWIVSDQSQKLYLWSKPTGVAKEYPLSFPKPEGVAFDEAANLLYIVSDSTNTLYVYTEEP
jgi:uncharacterized protein YjiK